MKKMLTLFSVLALAGLAGPAMADAGNTSESGNEVDCGTQTVQAPNPATGGALISVSDIQPGSTSGALVVCSSDSLPLDGRIVAQGDAEAAEGSVCADGDASNPGQGSGWACVSGGAASGGVEVKCGPEADDPATAEEETNSQTTAGQAAGSQAECEPEAPAA